MPKRVRLVASLLTLTALFPAAAARAAEEGAKEGKARASGAARAEDPAAEKARELYRQGSKYYDVGQFDKAIESWQQAYDQKPDPSFLFNIGQAYRQKDDPKNAIFFYKSYLRNAPKATNRADVEQRVAALQKQLDAAAAKPPATTLPPPVTTTTPPVTTATPPPAWGTEPPPVSTQPPPATTGVPSAVVEAPPPVLAPFEPPRRIDLGAALGFDSWSSGVQGKADPSFALTLSGGYTFGSPQSRVRFRLGALFGYTFLSEPGSKETFLSFLIDPTVEVRLSSAPRWFLTGDIGVGAMSISGLKPSSALLQQGQPLMINGAQGLGLIRFGAGLHYRFTPQLGAFVSPAIANSSRKEHFHADITRIEMLFGLTLRP